MICVYSSVDGGKTYKWGWVYVDSPMQLVVDSEGKTHLTSITVPTVPDLVYTFGGGLITVTTPSQPTQVFVDPTIFAYQVAPPKQPGECIVPYGVAAFALDNQYVYFCSAAKRADGSAWNWSRVAFQSSW